MPRSLSHSSEWLLGPAYWEGDDLRFFRTQWKTVVVAMVTAMVTASAPAIAHGVQHALFAHNSDKVDGKHAVGSGASANQASGKLVATGSSGKFAAKFLPPSSSVQAKRRNYDTAGGIALANGSAAVVHKVNISAPARGLLLVDPWSSFHGDGGSDSGLTWIEIDQGTDCEEINTQFPPNKVPGSRTLFELSADFYETVASPITLRVAKGAHAVTLCAMSVGGTITVVDAGLNVLFVPKGRTTVITAPGETAPGRRSIGR
jgi:hypothetical protein